MKENRHKAKDVLTRPWPGRQKERDGERMEEKKSEKRRQINIKEEEEEERKGTTECFRRKKKGDGER